MAKAKERKFIRVEAANPKLAVEIAKDVIAHINEMEIRTGDYVELFIERIPEEPSQISGCQTDDLQKYLQAGRIAECRVCALGAAVMSKIRLYDDCRGYWGSVGPNYARVSMHNVGVYRQLADIFGEHLSFVLESAFERRDMACDHPSSREHLNVISAVMYGDRFKRTNDKGLLRALMKNLIANDGSLVLPEYTGELTPS